MLELRLSTPSGRQTVIVDGNLSPKEVLDQNEIITDGAVVSLDGIPLTATENNTSFDDLGCGEKATLSVVVKTGNA